MGVRYLIDESGVRREVVLPLEEYDAMLARLEDLEDRLAVAEAWREGMSFRPYEEFLAETDLQKCG